MPPRKPPAQERPIIGSSPALRRALRLTDRVAPLPVTVLIIGETGVGKEAFARRLHEKSGRPGLLVTADCTRLDGELGASELFGHERGAFTGAFSPRRGLIEDADQGTLFLDEVGELTLPMQTRLLRFLQEGTIRRTGKNTEQRLDVRVVAATNRDLRKMVDAGTFREDLYWRLAGYTLTIPPLRERGGDMVAIARHLLAKDPVCGGGRRLRREAEALLQGHDWPGNVRELQKVLREIVVETGARVITGKHMERALGADAPSPRQPRKPRREGELVALIAGLGEVASGDLRGQLGVSRGELHRRLTPLLKAGRVERVGRGARTAYRIMVVDDRHDTSPTAAPASDALERVLALLQEQGSLSRGKVARLLGVTERSATRYLSALVEQGRVERRGAGRHVTYMPTQGDCNGSTELRGFEDSPA